MQYCEHIRSLLKTVAIAVLVLLPLTADAFPKIVLRAEPSTSRIRFIELALNVNKPDTFSYKVYNEGEMGDTLTWDVEVLDLANMPIKWVKIRNIPNNRKVPMGGKSGTFQFIFYGDSLKDLPPGEHLATIRFNTNDPTKVDGIMDIPINGHTNNFPSIDASWPDEWGARWWGFDMMAIYDKIVWGEKYTAAFNVINRGSAPLSGKLVVNNGWFTLSPDTFNLPNRDNSVRVIATYFAGDMNAQGGVITSESNNWDPGELNFRITVGKAEPVFKKGKALWGDVVNGLPAIMPINEDGAEELVARLDSIFICSDPLIKYAGTGEGITTRTLRTHDLMVKGKKNWNGETLLTVTATLGDSVLSDSIIVMVAPIPDPPGRFDLLSPSEMDTLNLDEDTLFCWQSSVDPDGDDVTYSLTLSIGDLDTVFTGLADTSFPTAVLAEIYPLETGGEFKWTVSATDGEHTTEAWSVFTNYLPDPIAVGQTILPEELSLSSVYPNPFNSSLTVRLNLIEPTDVDITIFDVFGRQVTRLASETNLMGRKSFVWDPSGLVSGEYIVKVQAGKQSVIHKVVMIR